MGAKGGGEKGEGLRQDMDVALQPRVHSGAQPGEERNLVVAGIPFSWEEKSGHSCWKEHYELQLSQWRLADWAVPHSCARNYWGARQTMQPRAPAQGK